MTKAYCENPVHSHKAGRRCCDACWKCPESVGPLRTVTIQGIRFRLCKQCAEAVKGYRQ